MAGSLDFVLVSDVRCLLDHKIPNGPWVHLATVMRNLPNGGRKEYIALLQLNKDRKVWIEEVVHNEKKEKMFRRIVSDAEWGDLYQFLMMHGCLLINPDQISVGKDGLIG